MKTIDQGKRTLLCRTWRSGQAEPRAGAAAPDWELEAWVQDWVAVEEPLEIRIHDEPLLTTMRTPGNDRELVVGLLLSEGLIGSRRDLARVAVCGRPGEEGYGNVMSVQMAPGRVLHDEDLGSVRRGTLTTSACGVCGRRRIDDLLERLSPVEPTRLSARQVAHLIAALGDHQPLFSKTGGLHAAGLAMGADYAWVYEDVGRHNAVDKVLGRAVLEGRVPLRDAALIVSGRSSFEIVQKAATAGIGALIGVSAPTSLAVQLAERVGMVLIGFAEDRRFKAYAGASAVGP